MPPELYSTKLSRRAGEVKDPGAAAFTFSAAIPGGGVVRMSDAERGPPLLPERRQLVEQRVDPRQVLIRRRARRQRLPNMSRKTAPAIPPATPLWTFCRPSPPR